MSKTLDTTRYEIRLAELLAEYGVPSAAIGILRDGVITSFAVGARDALSGEPATVETIYQCGSMTKTWTALAFMQLVDEGKVGLDEPVRTYLPDFRVADADVSAKVTPRQLLNHSNGIEEAYGDPGEGEDVYARMVEGITTAGQVFPLGRTHGYSAALGYAILARIMEVTDGAGWDAIMRRRLFEPLGLTSTSSWREQVDAGRAATGHILRSLDEGPIRTPVAYLPRSFGPGGNISSTVDEVLAMAHLVLSGGKTLGGKRIVSRASIDEMMHSRVPIPDPYMFGPWWGLGLIVCDWQGETAYASDGSTIGQNARLRILPDENVAITMMTNGGPRESLYKRVFNEILPELGAATVPELPKPNPTLELDLAKYVGAYERPGIRYEVEAEEGKLSLTFAMDPMQAQFLGKPELLRYSLLPIDETHFLLPSEDPLEDPQTLALFDFEGGAAQYLHTNSRVHPRVGS
jgi:CubicO group peptidase (beta-lactamase class C family)